jgi:hypothetical protein
MLHPTTPAPTTITLIESGCWPLFARSGLTVDFTDFSR